MFVYVVSGYCINGKGKVALAKVTKDWSLLAPQGTPVLAPLPLFLTSPGGGVVSEFVCLV